MMKRNVRKSKKQDKNPAANSKRTRNVSKKYSIWDHVTEDISFSGCGESMLDASGDLDSFYRN